MFTNKNLKFKSGFVLGIALISLSVLLLITISITIILLRDIRQSIAVTDSKIAYDLADSGIICVESILNNIKNISNNYSIFPFSINNLADHFSSSNFPDINPETIGCLGVPIFPADIINGNSLNYSNSNDDYSINVSVNNSNIGAYSNGINYKFKIKKNDFLKNSCLETEVHSTSEGSNFIISRGRVPCDSPIRVERVIVKRID